MRRPREKTKNEEIGNTHGAQIEANPNPSASANVAGCVVTISVRRFMRSAATPAYGVNRMNEKNRIPLSKPSNVAEPVIS